MSAQQTDADPARDTSDEEAPAIGAPKDAEAPTEKAAAQTPEIPLLGKGSALYYAIQTTGITALALTILAGVLQGTFWAVGTLIGGVLATLNLMVFARVAAAFIEQKGRSAPWAIIGGIKLLGLFLCVYIILSRGDISALAFMIGYGALPIGISIGTLRANRVAS